MTPYEFGILLHYYCRCGDPEEIAAPIGPSTVDQFLAEDLLQPHTDSSRVQRFGPFRQILAVIQSSAIGAEHPGNRAIAERIAEELFVNGAGQEAHRLVLTSRDGRDLGGWSKGPLTDRIVGVLAGVPGEK